MSFWDSVKKFAQPYSDEEYDDYDEDNGVFEDEEQDAAPRARRSSPFSSAAQSSESSYTPSAPSSSSASFRYISSVCRSPAFSYAMLIAPYSRKPKDEAGTEGTDTAVQTALAAFFFLQVLHPLHRLTALPDDCFILFQSNSSFCIFFHPVQKCCHDICSCMAPVNRKIMPSGICKHPCVQCFRTL